MLPDSEAFRGKDDLRGSLVGGAAEDVGIGGGECGGGWKGSTLLLPSRVVGLDGDPGLVEVPEGKEDKVGVVDETGVERCMTRRLTLL